MKTSRASSQTQTPQTRTPLNKIEQQRAETFGRGEVNVSCRVVCCKAGMGFRWWAAMAAEPGSGRQKGGNKAQVRMREDKDHRQDAINDTKSRRWLAKSRESPDAPAPRRQLAAGPTQPAKRALPRTKQTRCASVTSWRQVTGSWQPGKLVQTEGRKPPRPGEGRE